MCRYGLLPDFRNDARDVLTNMVCVTKMSIVWRGFGFAMKSGDHVCKSIDMAAFKLARRQQPIKLFVLLKLHHFDGVFDNVALAPQTPVVCTVPVMGTTS